MRSFNTAGPVKPDKHYCIPPLERIDLDEVLRLVRDEQYFVLHAPRQTGKTSALLAPADVLNGGGYQCVRYLALVARDAPLRVANPIYAEVVSRELAWVAQETLDVSPPRYVRSSAQVLARLHSRGRPATLVRVWGLTPSSPATGDR